MQACLQETNCAVSLAQLDAEQTQARLSAARLASIQLFLDASSMEKEIHDLEAEELPVLQQSLRIQAELEVW